MEKNNLTVPVAIVVAGLMIAGSLFITRGSARPVDNTAALGGLPNTADIIIAPITDADHILGNPQAEVFIVEYSDTECPYCKQFHPTMHQLADTYAKDGKVAWVYRHFPLYKGDNPLHSKAGKEAEATECAAELGGNTGFWKYLDEIYSVTPANNGLDPAELSNIAVRVGLNKANFDACLSSGKYAQKISDDYDKALAAGGTGTPYTVIITKDGSTKLPIEGAQPFAKIKALIDSILAAKGNGGVISPTN